MSYELISNLGNAIDNVYNYTAEDASRRTLASLKGDCLEISFQTIVNIARESDLQFQIVNLKKEGNDLINSRLRIIKSEFKQSSKRSLIVKKTSSIDNLETLTVSPYSPSKTLKFTLIYTYEVK